MAWGSFRAGMCPFIVACLVLGLSVVCTAYTRGYYPSPLKLAVTPSEKFSWHFLNFTFQTAEDYNNYTADTTKYYENCMLAGVKVDSMGNYYVSVPRWKDGVPATLNKLIPQPNGEALLMPYPSWEMNAVGDPDALQSVLGFEIDFEDQIWILDQGKVGGNPAIPGSIKLVVWDLVSNMSVQTYHFPDDQASAVTSFLNDIVVDPVHNFAYITDSGVSAMGDNVTYGGLLVYNASSNEAWRVLDNSTSTQANYSLWIEVNGNPVLATAPMRTGADGIALSDDAATLYYCPLTSRTLYAISTSELRQSTVTDMSQFVVDLGDKVSASDGLACDNSGRLYLTALEANSIFVVDSINGREQVTGLVQQLTYSPAIEWPDTMGFDHHGNLVFVTNSLDKFVQGEMNFSVAGNPPNFYIWSAYIGADSYLAPPPSTSSSGSTGEVSSYSSSDGHQTALIVIVVFVCLAGVAVVGVFAFVARRAYLQDQAKRKRYTTLPVEPAYGALLTGQ